MYFHSANPQGKDTAPVHPANHGLDDVCVRAQSRAFGTEEKKYQNDTQ